MFRYALDIAQVVSERSEDPYLQVGAVIIDTDKRIIATGYNGLPPGITADQGFWEDRGLRRRYMLHAEINALSMVTRQSKPWFMAITHSPCQHCVPVIAAHGIKTIVFDTQFRDWDEIADLAAFYEITIKQKEP